MIVNLISLILIFIENSISVNSILVGISLPYLSFILGKKKNLLLILLVYVFMSLQSDRYFFNFFLLSLFCGVNFFIFRFIEYSRKISLYLPIMDIIFYFLYSYRNFEIEYLLVNIIFFIIFNYIYTARSREIKGNK